MYSIEKTDLNRRDYDLYAQFCYMLSLVQIEKTDLNRRDYDLALARFRHFVTGQLKKPT